MNGSWAEALVMSAEAMRVFRKVFMMRELKFSQVITLAIKRIKKDPHGGLLDKILIW